MKTDPHFSFGKGTMGMCVKYMLRPLSISGEAQQSRGTAEAEHSLCWHSQWSSCHPPLWSPQAPGTKARLRARHLGTSQGSCHLPAPHLAIPCLLPSLSPGGSSAVLHGTGATLHPPAPRSKNIFLLGWEISLSQVRVWSMADLQALSWN